MLLSQSILEYNGGCVVAMAGKDCVAIASDRRLGVQLVRACSFLRKRYRVFNTAFVDLQSLSVRSLTSFSRMSLKERITCLCQSSFISDLKSSSEFDDCLFCQTTVAMDANRIFQMNDKLFLGLTGLMTDITTLDATFRFKLSLYKLREGRDIKPRTFANLVSSTLYGQRFGPYFSEPVIAGLGSDNKPFICSADLLGALSASDDFAVSGTCAESLFGTCETFYRPNMNPDELFETLSQCLLAALDRDCLSGWGAVVHVITKEGVTTKNLVARMD